MRKETRASTGAEARRRDGNGTEARRTLTYGGRRSAVACELLIADGRKRRPPSQPSIHPSFGHSNTAHQPAVVIQEQGCASSEKLTGFGFLTLNSLLAIYRSHGDIAGITFVATSYLSLLLLFWCLQQYKRAPANSPAKSRSKAGVWFSSSLLTVVFSWRVSALMPWPVAAAVWLMAASTVVGGFYTLFLWSGRQ
uniref:Uncharacterized protein n=1 Tax=Oryza nivara TaxID=4536 RepID=A0A0E0FHV2_ORYNI